MKKKENIFDTKVKISTIIWIILAVVVLWWFISAKVSANKFEQYRNDLDSLDTRLQKVATGEYYEGTFLPSYLRTGTFTTQEAMQEVYDLEAEYDELKREIGRDNFEGTRGMLLDMDIRWLEQVLVGEKQLILKVHKFGWEATGDVWSRELTEYQKEQEYGKIRLGS